jgi:hypothetical protein
MKNAGLLLYLLFLSTISYSQKIVSGTYDSGLILAYDSVNNIVTGYYENGTGWDEATNSPKFSCTFYIDGIPEGNTVKIKTYYPGDKLEDVISGNLEIVDNKTVQIALFEEHGGCWNVQHFTNEPVTFSLQNEKSWVQIRYINIAKSHFYSGKTMDKKLKSYLVKKDVVCIETVDKNWAYCVYYGKKITKGWIKTADLNSLDSK